MTTALTAPAEAAPEGAKNVGGSVSVPRTRMAGRVDLAKPVDGDQRVHLRGGHRRMAEQFLDDADVGPAVEEMGGERVPQGVRGHLGAQARALRGRPQDGPGALP